MSDGSLSQDEIDALLAGGGGMDMGSEPAPAPKASAGGGPDLHSVVDLLGGLTGSLSSNLAAMLGKDVEIGMPSGGVVSRGELAEGLGSQIVVSRFDLTGNLAGEHAYLLGADIGTAIAGLMMGQEGVELNDAALSALEEAGNTMAGSMVTELSDRVGDSVTSAPGQTQLSSSDELDFIEDSYLRVSYPVTVEGESPSEIVEVFSIPLASQINDMLSPAAPSRRATAPSAPSNSSMSGGGARRASNPPASSGGGSLGSMFGEPPAGNPFGGGQTANVQSVQFPSLTAGGGGATDQGNISLLMDVYMEMTVELGRTRKLIRDILGMGEGTIIELDKLAGEPVDILVNHKLIAKGEVVVIDENFGVRVTEIVSPLDRVSDM
ncbi:MAG TPA: flagellar motor switch protein FliN [Spirochaetia bacterium]|nr:flagellar motor switch protein FliN [Spirochaetia bacterium]